MTDKPPKNAIPVRRQKPPPHQRVLLWVSDRNVAIEHLPIIGWSTYGDGWWSGLPGDYHDLRRLRWKVTHWMPLSVACGQKNAEPKR